MEKKYIKPITDMHAVAAQQMMAGSIGKGADGDAGQAEARGIDLFTADDVAENNEYPVYNVWED